MSRGRQTTREKMTAWYGVLTPLGAKTKTSTRDDRAQTERTLRTLSRYEGSPAAAVTSRNVLCVHVLGVPVREGRGRRCERN